MPKTSLERPVPLSTALPWAASVAVLCGGLAGAAPTPPPAVPAKPAAPPAAAAKPTPPAAAPGAAKADAAGTGAATAGAAPFTLAQATQGLKGTGGYTAQIELEQGGGALPTLRCELFADKTPIAVANFIGLARGVRPFKDPATSQWVKRPLYDKTWMHRLVPDYIIQGGDPYCQVMNDCGGRYGTGDPGYAIADEPRDDLRFDRPGRLAMANKGPGTAGSQFFITDRETPWLNGAYTIFGQCDPVDGIHTIARLETTIGDVPKVPVVIKRIVIGRKP